jgi:hypothetical protein
VPKGLLPLVAALAFFTLIVIAVLAWAFLGGQAGEQRGMVVTSEIREPITIELEDGRSARIPAFGRQQTFVIQREDFPQRLRAIDDDGNVIVEQTLTYDEVASEKFRISVDRNGFYPTNTIRTPAP